jgi:hypothetical protein
VPVVQQASADDTVIRLYRRRLGWNGAHKAVSLGQVMRRRPVPDEPRADQPSSRCVPGARAVAPPTPWAALLPGQEIQLAPAVLAKRHPVILYGQEQRRRPAFFIASVR